MYTIKLYGVITHEKDMVFGHFTINHDDVQLRLVSMLPWREVPTMLNNADDDNANS